MNPLEAHFRLMQALTVRTHERREMEKPKYLRHGEQRPRQEVVINGKKYASLTKAAKALKTNRYAIARILGRKKDPRKNHR